MATEEIRRLAARQHDRLVERDDKLLAELAKRYAESYRTIEDALARLGQQMQKARAAGEEIKPSWLFERERLAQLLVQVRAELASYGKSAQATIERGQLAGALAGEDAAIGLMREGRIDLNFVRLPARAIEAIVGRTLHDDSPLTKTLARFEADGAEKVKSTLIRGVTLGYGPAETARLLKKELGGNLGQWMRLARTEVVGAYRNANLASYAANADILSGWEWMTHEDEKTCAYCLSMDGSIHKLEDPMEEHPNGRCSALPVLRINP